MLKKHKKTDINPNTGRWLSALKSRKLMLLLVDIALCASIGLLFILLYDKNIYSLANRMLELGILLICIFVSKIVFKIYRQVWRYATTREYLYMIWADLIAGIFYIILSRILLQNNIQLVFWLALSIVTVNCLATLSTRFLYKNRCSSLKKSICGSDEISGKGVNRWLNGIKRWLSNHLKLPAIATVQAKHHSDINPTETETTNKMEYSLSNNQINVAIVGAGRVGVLLARKLLLNKSAYYRPYCFIDLDPQKSGNIISGLPVFPEKGIIERLQTMPVQEIVFAISNLSGEAKQKLYDFYKQSNCRVKLFDFEFGRESDSYAKRVLREFEIEDLLFREVINFNEYDSLDIYQGRTILITGGGGSIGSELCRQLAKLKPHKLVIFDIHENSAYDIEQELLSKYGSSIQISVEIGSVRDKDRLAAIFEMHHPQIVFHAAAHKHVPLMEHSCGEAIKNNVFGTLNIANIAEEYGAERFLLVSTDKAVNPTNVMGASKRLCEMIIQSRKNSKTNFVAVRFGNVLGSNGSVIPLFKKQIASGGPITLTDKRIIRYFMTIPEAAQLLLQTCAMASSGEIYVLNMGRPVKILELAENMIRLSGLTPYVDIDIQEIGLRPGEKLYEELLMKTGELDKTASKMIFIERDQALTAEQLEEKLEILERSLADRNQQAVIAAMYQTVPTYHCTAEINENAGQMEEMQSCSGRERSGNPSSIREIINEADRI